jgi:uridine phosphorylase
MPEDKRHPEHHINMVSGDIAPTVLIAEDPAYVLLFAQLMDEAHKVAEKREYLTYTGQKDRVPISCTSTGLGCPPTSIGVEELWHIGAKNILRIGTCTPIQPQVRVGDLVIVTGAVRDEHTSEEYISTEYPAVADYRLVRALLDACQDLGYRHHQGIVRTHDAYYLESPDAQGTRTRVQKWKDLGVLAVDMESSALFVIANISGFRAGAVLLAGFAGGERETGGVPENLDAGRLLNVGIAAAKLLSARGLA